MTLKLYDMGTREGSLRPSAPSRPAPAHSLTLGLAKPFGPTRHPLPLASLGLARWSAASDEGARSAGWAGWAVRSRSPRRGSSPAPHATRRARLVRVCHRQGR